MPDPNDPRFQNPNILADYSGGESRTFADSGMQVVQQPTVGNQLAALLNMEGQRMRPMPQRAPRQQMMPQTRPDMAAQSVGAEGARARPTLGARRPVYLKMMTSPGVVPGYARASVGDHGAVFGGWEY